MSAILSADDLNDFISPGVACIKPVETLPAQRPDKSSQNAYEVTTEEDVTASASDARPAQISLTDCLACSGCVTSAEAVLIGLQSHEEVLSTLDKHGSLTLDQAAAGEAGLVFVASVSPQTRATLAATYKVSEKVAGWMIEQLLAGPHGLAKDRKGFQWIFDTNRMREVCVEATKHEFKDTIGSAAADASAVSGQHKHTPKRPILASSCPGWICYAEKTHPYVLPHLSKLKSPQALTGTLVKSVLSRKFGIPPDKIWHLAIMPCFDKKLEASREELTDAYWRPEQTATRGTRDVDCVITARELLMLADTKHLSFPALPRLPLASIAAFPDSRLHQFMFGEVIRSRRQEGGRRDAGSSGGYAFSLLEEAQKSNPGSEIRVERGRNVDVVEYTLVLGEEVLLKTARYYGFRNIQNLVRKLKPHKQSRMPGSRRPGAGATSNTALMDFAYIEVMACPGGCTNGGGQIKADDVSQIRGLPGSKDKRAGPAEQKEWLLHVDEAYYSADSSDDEDAMQLDSEANANVNGDARSIIDHWASITDLGVDKLLYTTYREVESDVGKAKSGSDMDRVAGLASSVGGGW